MDLLSKRLQSHGISRVLGNSVKEIGEHYGCLQAQDIRQAKRVIGSRLNDCTIENIDQAIAGGVIIRTRPMRGTLHYMDPNLVHLMIEVCASRTLNGFAKRREYLGISDSDAEQALEIMELHLRGGNMITRSDLDTLFQEKGLAKQTQRIYHLTCYAGTRGLICFGPSEGKEDTYVLLDERVEKPAQKTREEQLTVIAETYFRAHGPATIDDLAWRTGLTKGDCKTGLGEIEDHLEQIEQDGKTYYWLSGELKTFLASGLEILGGFDEYFLGYKDRAPVADISHHGKYFSVNGIFYPLILVDGKVVGVWKRTMKKNSVVIEWSHIDKTIEIDETLLRERAEEYARFWGKGSVELKKK